MAGGCGCCSWKNRSTLTVQWLYSFHMVLLKILRSFFPLILLVIPGKIISQEQAFKFEFGLESNWKFLSLEKAAAYDTIQWVNVNTNEDTWARNDEGIVCYGNPIGVVRSQKQYENFLLHIEWKHMEPGGNSGVFVWSKAVPGQNRLPDGVEVQMLELDWVKLNDRDGKKPPEAYVHGELFGVGGVEIVPDNPRGVRSKSIENLCKPRGEWNTYDVICVDGVIKLSVNGTFVNGISKSSQKKGHICLESEGAEIHFRNLRLVELPGNSKK